MPKKVLFCCLNFCRIFDFFLQFFEFFPKPNQEKKSENPRSPTPKNVFGIGIDNLAELNRQTDTRTDTPTFAHGFSKNSRFPFRSFHKVKHTLWCAWLCWDTSVAGAYIWLTSGKRIVNDSNSTQTQQVVGSIFEIEMGSTSTGLTYIRNDNFGP